MRRRASKAASPKLAKRRFLKDFQRLGALTRRGFRFAKTFDAMALRPGFYARLPTERPNPRTRNIDLLGAASIVRLINREDAAVARAVGREAGAIARAARGHQRLPAAQRRLLFVGAGTSGRLGVLEPRNAPRPSTPSPARSWPRWRGPELGLPLARGGGGRPRRRGEGGRRAPARGRRRRDRGERRHAFRALGAQGGLPARLPDDPRHLEWPAASNPRRDHHRAARGPGGHRRLDAPEMRDRGQDGPQYLDHGGHDPAWQGLRPLDGGLEPTSRKLRLRGARIVCELGRVGPRRAEGLLEAAGGSVKLAVLMARTGLAAGRARLRLARAEGSLRSALEAA